jgi:hypothetical protein|tara:strand:+ start:1693 stop:1926 length:234 start_codon:yes stop_codon:yes gene_type:complete
MKKYIILDTSDHLTISGDFMIWKNPGLNIPPEYAPINNDKTKIVGIFNKKPDWVTTEKLYDNSEILEELKKEEWITE